MPDVEVSVVDRKFDVTVVTREVAPDVVQRVVDVTIARRGVEAGVLSRTVDVVVVGIQGPRGGPGEGGGDGARLIIHAAAGASPVGGHRVVALDGGVLRYADNTIDDDDSLVIGLSLNAASIGGDVSVLAEGQEKMSGWSWNVGKPIYLSTNGNLTQTPPASPAIFSITIGQAVAADTINVRIEPSIRL